AALLVGAMTPVVALTATLGVAYFGTFFILGTGAAFRYYFPSYILLQMAVMGCAVNVGRRAWTMGVAKRIRASAIADEGQPTLRTRMLSARHSSTQLLDDVQVSAAAAPLVTVVMPCLNESDTLETCIQKAVRAFREHDLPGEIVVADNGSTDGSQEIAV